MHVVLKESTEVANHLDRLGTTRDQLIETIGAMVAARRECTDNDPLGTPGYRSWQMGSRRLRELHIGVDDWQKDDTDGVSSIVSHARGLRMVVCNTDDGTCRDGGDGPQNRSKKGAATDRAVDDNTQSAMFFMDAPAETIIKLKGPGEITSVARVTTYYLCVFANGDDVRGELSCPTAIENGFFKEFGPRLFLLGGDVSDGGPTKKSLPGDSEYKITVEKKKK
jgi:hypothetical protein